MSVPHEQSPVELPAPDPALVLLRVFIEAHLATVSRRKGERFLRLIAEKLASEESLAEVFAIRPHPKRAEIQRARRQAAELFGVYLPTFVAVLGD